MIIKNIRFLAIILLCNSLFIFAASSNTYDPYILITCKDKGVSYGKITGTKETKDIPSLFKNIEESSSIFKTQKYERPDYLIKRKEIIDTKLFSSVAFVLIKESAFLKEQSFLSMVTSGEKTVGNKDYTYDAEGIKDDDFLITPQIENIEITGKTNKGISCRGEARSYKTQFYTFSFVTIAIGFFLLNSKLCNR